MYKHLRFETLAKAGYTARGVVFLLVAALALFSGIAGSRPETKAAVTALMEQPLGRLWVAFIGFGLLGFVAWRIAQSLADSDGHGNDAKGLTIRAALLGSAVTYLGLATYAVGLAFLSGSSEGGGEKGLAGWVMSQPFGSYLAIAIGAGFIVGGMITATKGVLRKFEKYITIPRQRTLLAWICVYGLVSRGVVFAVTGVLFAYAGFTVDPSQAGSMADALEWLNRLPFGTAIYTVVAAGLAAFGIYNLIEARYRIVRGPKLGRVKQALSSL